MINTHPTPVNEDGDFMTRMSPERLRRVIVEGHLYEQDDSSAEDISTYFEIVKAIKDGRMFWFGDNNPSVKLMSKHSKRYLRLLLDGHIDHPFNEPYVIAMNDYEGTKLWSVVPDEDTTLVLTVVAALRNDDNSMDGLAALGVFGINLLDVEIVDDIPGKKAGMRVKNPVIIQETGSLLDPTEAMCSVINATLYAIGILATDGVDVSVEAYPPKLNRRRIKRGQSPVPPYYKVNLRNYITAITNTHRLDSEHGDGTHASPIPHLRRGHVRRLTEERTTWVRDCLVNFRKDALPPVHRSHYDVSRNRLAQKV
jgi:hypothetical protein